MKLPEIAEEALSLNEQERAALALTLMDTLSAASLEISDEEAIRRDKELENGTVAPLTHEEFVRRVQEARRN
jgi:hypothetical protein